jgi:hypothetical protein
MLWLERQVVRALTGTDDPLHQAAIETFVDGALRSMPEHLRAGVAAESLGLGVYVRLQLATGRLTDEALRDRLDHWEDGPISLVSQYVHMLRSLVLFAEHELAPAG